DIRMDPTRGEDEALESEALEAELRGEAGRASDPGGAGAGAGSPDVRLTEARAAIADMKIQLTSLRRQIDQHRRTRAADQARHDRDAAALAQAEARVAELDSELYTRLRELTEVSRLLLECQQALAAEQAHRQQVQEQWQREIAALLNSRSW